MDWDEARSRELRALGAGDENASVVEATDTVARSELRLRRRAGFPTFGDEDVEITRSDVALRVIRENLEELETHLMKGT